MTALVGPADAALFAAFVAVLAVIGVWALLTGERGRG